MQLDIQENQFLVSTNSHSDFSQKNKKYAKITTQVKEKFLKYIIDENMSIKQASQNLRINYSSAKAILSSHKKSIRFSKKQQNSIKQSFKRSTFKEINTHNLDIHSKLKIIFSIGGKNQHIVEELKVKQIFKPSILVQCSRMLRNQKQSTDQQN